LSELSALTIDQLRARLQAYLDAEASVLRNQSYTVAGRSLTRANLTEIRKGIGEIGGEIDRRAGAATTTVRRGAPIP
jgi:hypothetical protein